MFAIIRRVYRLAPSLCRQAQSMSKKRLRQTKTMQRTGARLNHSSGLSLLKLAAIIHLRCSIDIPRHRVVIPIYSRFPVGSGQLCITRDPAITAVAEKLVSWRESWDAHCSDFCHAESPALSLIHFAIAVTRRTPRSPIPSLKSGVTRRSAWTVGKVR
jgi:hypothetical protein